jgi:FRG domain
MSLKGQWVARYIGNTNGVVVPDLDEASDHYRGTAIAWSDSSEHLNSLVRIRTPSKATTQRLTQVPVIPLYANGNIVPSDVIEQLKTSGKLLFPATADIEIDLKGENLELSWQTPVGSYGRVDLAPKTRGGTPSELKPHRINTWERFKDHVNKLERKRYIFRGQENSTWRLRSSFFRAGRADLERYQFEDVNVDINKLVSNLVHIPLDLSKPQHFLSTLHLAQHHGYPTPLLDWTWSPYVAAYFAFSSINSMKSKSSRSKVRIFQLDAREWNASAMRADKIFPFQPHVTIVDPLAIANNRAIPQQSSSTYSNIDDIETYIQNYERIRPVKYLEVFDIPVRNRDAVMHELALMGVTAGSLFPGLDGAFTSLKERNFS